MPSFRIRLGLEVLAADVVAIAAAVRILVCMNARRSIDLLLLLHHIAIHLPKVICEEKLIGLLTERFRVGEREPIAGIAGRRSHSFFSRPAESFTG